MYEVGPMSHQNISLLIARIPPKIMLAVLTLLALSSAGLVHWEIEKTQRQLADEHQINARKNMSGLLVAARDIAEGESISADALRLATVESGRLPVGALSDTAAALGLQAKFPICAGDSILSANLQAPRKATGFQTRIKSGLRAITFPVDASTGVAGFLTPDCRVDILAQTGSGADARAVPILSDVQVVAVGQTFRKKPGEEEAQPASNVTVAVLPAQGAKLINAMTTGKLYCLMRNQADHQPLAVRDISSAFPDNKPVQPNGTELSQMPLPPRTPSAVAPPAKSESAPLPPPLHNVDIWSADKRDALTFPQP
jgi:pilus assembly protein CpaB